MWRPTYGVTVAGVKAFQVGGGSAWVEALKYNAGSPHIVGTPIRTTAAGSWVYATSYKGTKIAAGSTIWGRVKRQTGSPSQVAVQIDITFP
jgi:hypothetical protein